MKRTLATSPRFWDDIADRYSNKPIANPGAYQRKLDATKARLQPDHVLLDIGCGTGSLALELAPLVSHVHAIDLSSAMIRIANRKAADQGIRNVTFYNTTLEDASSFERESFDAICAYNLLHLVEDLERTVGTIFDLLAPGGSFISSTGCLRETWVPFGLILPVMRLFNRAPHVLMLHIEDVEEALAAAGLVEITRKKVSDDKTTAFLLASKPG